MEEKNEKIEDRLVILTKETLDRLLKEKNSGDLIALYTFFYYTSKWQETREVKATQNYVKKGLGWGIKKVSDTEKKLEELGLIKKIEKKNELGQVTGWYVHVNYVFSGRRAEKVTKETPLTTFPLVDEAVSGEQETNALITSIPNTVITNTVKEVTLPIHRGDNPTARVISIYGTLFYDKYGFLNKSSFGSMAKVINELLGTYNEIQLAYLLIIFFEWCGMNGGDQNKQNYLTSKTHSLYSFKFDINSYEAYIRNVLGKGKEFDDSDSLLEIVGKYILELKNR